MGGDGPRSGVADRVAGRDRDRSRRMSAAPPYPGRLGYRLDRTETRDVSAPAETGHGLVFVTGG